MNKRIGKSDNRMKVFHIVCCLLGMKFVNKAFRSCRIVKGEAGNEIRVLFLFKLVSSFMMNPSFLVLVFLATAVPVEHLSPYFFFLSSRLARPFAI